MFSNLIRRLRRDPEEYGPRTDAFGQTVDLLRAPPSMPRDVCDLDTMDFDHLTLLQQILNWTDEVAAHARVAYADVTLDHAMDWLERPSAAESLHLEDERLTDIRDAARRIAESSSQIAGYPPRRKNLDPDQEWTIAELGNDITAVQTRTDTAIRVLCSQLRLNDPPAAAAVLGFLPDTTTAAGIIAELISAARRNGPLVQLHLLTNVRTLASGLGREAPPADPSAD